MMPSQARFRFPRDCCLHQQFEEQVARRPNAIALSFAGATLTYAELNRRANRLAHYLRTLGVGPEVLVGLFAERSLDMLVGVLGILKAGGAYVPLDPSYPQERLAFMLQDADVAVLLTQQGLLDHLPQHSARVICLDTDWPRIAQENADTPSVNTTSGNLAYVIYTSGSTGQPKGVMVTHNNVVRLLRETEAWFHFNATDVWSLCHSLAFDFSVWELWGALGYGGRLVVVPYWVSRSPEALSELLRAEQVTVLNQTPSAFRQLMPVVLASLSPEALSLRYIIFAGEVLDIPSLWPWMERHGDQHPRLVNMYGITETTVHVSYRPLTWADMRVGVGSVIGGPIPDLQIHLLDHNRQPVPLGAVGEMYIGGAGVARGYLRRPELTAERFVDDVFAPASHARLYKSGDLARQHANGDLEYLGRSDQQVKIRGYRIELGEIETVLRLHPLVRDAVVIPREDTPGDKRLVAYLVLAPTRWPTARELRSFVHTKLPEYMIPACFEFLDVLPLTANGKVDRRALPPPGPARADVAQPFVAPRTPEEEVLAGIWQEVLNVERVGVHDNFFELGGHSLKATQATARIRATLQLELSVRAVFETPTVAGIAALIVQHREQHAPPAELTHLVAELEELSEEEARREISLLHPKALQGKTP